MEIIKIISTKIQNARRLIKFERKGRSDVREKNEVGPFGIDSNAPKDIVGVYSSTSTSGQGVVLGYVNTNQKADVGEFRTYAVDSNGNEVFYTWIKNDGTMELGGTADNLARYQQIADSINELKDDLSDLKQVFSTWVPVPQDGGAALKSAAATWYGTPLVEDITLAKIDEIKTL